VNEYEILLSYLEKKDRPGFKRKKNDQVKSFEDISKETKKSSPVEVSSTKKIIEECQEEKRPIGTPQLPTISIGFDVDKFENMMRSRLIDDYKKLQSYERPYISVTELFYCLRKSYYTRLKYTTDLKKQFNFAYLDLINRVGNTIHDYVQEIYNFTETEKTVVTDKYRVKGRVDAIYDKYLYEFKTMDEKKFTGIYIKEHYYQPIIYSYILNSEYNYNIQTITLVYFFRDNLKRKPYSIDLPIDDKIAIGFLDQASLLHNCISSKEVPEPLNSNQEQCYWCPYKTYCEKDKSKMKKPFELIPSKNTKTKEKEIDLVFDEPVKKSPEKKEAVFLL
jgi:hypothetical protein